MTLTIVLEPDDGWFIARINEEPAAISQGRTAQDAAVNVLDALRLLAFARASRNAPLQEDA